MQPTQGPQNSMAINSSRPIGHRLYLSALVLLLVVGAAVVVGTCVVVLHDRAVTIEDHACFKTAEQARWFRAKAATTRAEYPLLTTVLEEQAAAALGNCNNYSQFGSSGDGGSARAWLFGSPRMKWAATASLSLLAFVPAVLLWVIARWVRWLLRP